MRTLHRHKKHHSYFHKARSLAPLAAALLLASGAASAAPMYTITDLGTLLGSNDQVFALDLNNSGQVVGYSSDTINVHAFRWQNNVMTDLGTLGGGSFSVANGINNFGQVVGYNRDGLGQQHAFLWDEGAGMTNLDALGANLVSGINNSGQIVGTTNNGFGSHAYLLDDEAGMIDLGTLPDHTYSSARSVNDGGQVVGHSAPNPREGGLAHAFLWQEGRGMIDLGDLPEGYDFSDAYNINNSGQVVGGSGALTGTHAFLWQEGVGMRDLDTLSANGSVATGINNSGHVVGYSSGGAFRWDDSEGMLDLYSLLTNPEGWWTLDAAEGINDVGQIAGYGLLNGVRRGFLLTPVGGELPPPPPTPGDGSSASTPLFPEEPPADAPPPEEGAPIVFEFAPFDVAPEETVFIDPVIAVGYDYIVNCPNNVCGPNIASVLLPTIADDDGHYQIYLWDDTALAFYDTPLGTAFAGIEFFFGAGGVDRFRVLGIDQAAMLEDLANPQIFVTGLTFVSAGTVDMSMAPVTLFVADTGGGGATGVAEPGAITLFGAGLVGLGWARRRRA